MAGLLLSGTLEFGDARFPQAHHQSKAVLGKPSKLDQAAEGVNVAHGKNQSRHRGRE